MTNNCHIKLVQNCHQFLFLFKVPCILLPFVGTLFDKNKRDFAFPLDSKTLRFYHFFIFHSSGRFTAFRQDLEQLNKAKAKYELDRNKKGFRCQKQQQKE